MMVSGQAMFLLVPNQSNKRVLAPGKLTQCSADKFSVTFEEAFQFENGLQTLVFFETRGKFFQQGAQLLEIKTEEAGPSFCFQKVGEVVSAEQRQTFRVSVAVSLIHADFARQKKCHVVDFSPEGLAVIAAPGIALGSTQPLCVKFEDSVITAEARIQTIKELPSGKTRYGLLIDKTNVAARKTLQKISITFQRTQLKRLAGAA